jgi:hypothetical protein
MNKNIAIAAAVIAFAAVQADAAPKTPAPTKEAPKVEVLLKSVASTMDKRLKDYPTARFRDVHVGLLDGGESGQACGYVNSKNSSGAYVGWQQFYAIVDAEQRAQVLFIADDEVTSKVIGDSCEKISFVPGEFSKSIAPR